MRTLAGRAKVELARHRGDVHLKFCMTLAGMQMEGGRYFIYEHPKSAASWDNPDVNRLASTEGVMRTELDQCEFGLMSRVYWVRHQPRNRPHCSPIPSRCIGPWESSAAEGTDMSTLWPAGQGQQHIIRRNSARPCAEE